MQNDSVMNITIYLYMQIILRRIFYGECFKMVEDIKIEMLNLLRVSKRRNWNTPDVSIRNRTFFRLREKPTESNSQLI